MEVNKDVINVLKNEFTSNEEKRFFEHFQMYLVYGDDNDKFVINLDDTWEWMGFCNKGNANRCLKKTFDENVDYIVDNLLHKIAKQHGGHNKENIMMNVTTFKSLCMLSNSTKGKETRKYYIKLENYFMKLMKLQHNDIILSMQQENKRQLEIQRHNDLRNAHKDKPCIYIMKINEEKEDDTLIVKIGETDDIYQRTISLQ